MSSLNLDDINLLLKSLDALEKQAGMDLFAKHVTRAIVGKENVDVDAEYEDMQEKRRPEAEAITILKAKLILLRDKKEIDELTLEDLVN